MSRYHPLVLVGALPATEKEEVVAFLKEFSAPCHLDATSGIREEKELEHLKIFQCDDMLSTAKRCGYPIDCIVRIGGIPTVRLWRDLEAMEGEIEVISLSHLPFPGISWGTVLPLHTPVERGDGRETAKLWLSWNRMYQRGLLDLFAAYPESEPSLIYQLSQVIPHKSHVYLGNSLPIREWTLAATMEQKELEVMASRGVNGIDGQISTFLGLAEEGRENWGIFGDLTTLYDLAGPWILKQMKEVKIRLVVINNGGGMIFDRMFQDRAFLNSHDISFESLAHLWKIPYTRGFDAREYQHCLMEQIPSYKQTCQFHEELKAFIGRFTETVDYLPMNL